LTIQRVPVRPMKSKYKKSLRSIPAPGTGCHPSLLSVANLGVIAGVEPEQIFNDIRRAIPHGGRFVPDREIDDTIKKAKSDYRGGIFTPRPRPKPIVKNGKAGLQKIISQAQITDDVDFWEASPIRLFGNLRYDAIMLLKTLFKPNDLLFIGERYQKGILTTSIRTAWDWATFFKKGGSLPPHILINPLSGDAAQSKSGDKSMRCDACVKSFKHCLVEFDDLTLEEQFSFWAVVKLPVVALIHSGGKSIHAWIDVQMLFKVETLKQWDTEIKRRLYDRILKPLGVDGACSNSARLSRLPGHHRENKSIQKLLWLSPKGRPVYAAST